MIANQVGNPVRGRDFYGRESFIDLVWERLNFGHVLLSAPRRFGKTSVMFRLLDEPRWDYRLVHADLEHFSHPAELITALAVHLARHQHLSPVVQSLSYFPRDLWRKFRENFSEVELNKVKLKLRESIEPNWQARGEELFRCVAGQQDKTVFILDEFPMMIDTMAIAEEKPEEARRMLRWLRALRQAPENQNVRFLVAGSIGMGHVLSKIGETRSMNDFETLRLEPFRADVAHEFLRELGDGAALRLSGECRETMMELVGTGVPYFLQLLFSEVSKAHRIDGLAITPDSIGRIYHETVLGVSCKTYFEHYYGRLREYYQRAEERASKKILREIAVRGSLARDVCETYYAEMVGQQYDPDEFHRLMSSLEDEFYLAYDGKAGRYVFSCKILRDWWLRHYGA